MAMTPDPITAHTLARMLMDGPDHLVVVPAGPLCEAPTRPPASGTVRGPSGYHPAVFLLPAAPSEMPGLGPGASTPVAGPPWRRAVAPLPVSEASHEPSTVTHDPAYDRIVWGGSTVGPPERPREEWTTPLDLGGATVGLRERADGSVSVEPHVVSTPGLPDGYVPPSAARGPVPTEFGGG